MDSSNKNSDRVAALDAIRAIGAKSVPYLRRELRRNDSKPAEWLAKVVGAPFDYTPAIEYKERALDAIRVLGPSAQEIQPELEKMLRRGELPLKVAATITIVNSNAVEVLVECLSHTNSSVRQAVAWAVSKAGPHNEQSVDKLLFVLNDADGEVRKEAAYSLGVIRMFPDRVLPQLTASLSDANFYFQTAIQIAIGSYGTNARSATPALLALLNEYQGGRKGSVVATLRMIDEPAASQAGFGRSDLVRMLRSSDEQDKLVAGVAIWHSQDKAHEFIPALADALSDTNITVRRLAMTSLGNYGKFASNALPVLAIALEDPSESLRFAATSAVRRIDPTWFATNSTRN